MVAAINNEFTEIPESEKIRLIDEALNHPRCPIPREVIRSLTKEAKVALFYKLAEMGVLKLKEKEECVEETINNRGVPREETRTAPRNSERYYSGLYSIIGTYLQKNIDVAISQKARQQGLYIIGANGTGKSTLLANLILADIKQGFCVCLIEPHGDLTKTIIAGLPENRLKDVILLDIMESEYPFGLNLFQCPKPRTIKTMAEAANFVSHVFAKVWGAGTDTPRLMQVLRAVTRTLIENPGTTFSEMPILLSSDSVRERMVDNITNSSIVSFLEVYSSMSARDKAFYIDSTMNKVTSFLDQDMIRNIVSQSKTTIDFREIMDSGKILLVKLYPQFEEASMLLGAVIIGKLLMAAFSRADTPEQNRRKFNLHCDEYQRFATSDFATLISEAIKFIIATTLSHQTLSQVDDANRTAAIAAGNLIVFRVSGYDAKALARNFDTTPTKEIAGEEPVRAPVADVIAHLVRRGHNDAMVTRFAQVYLQNFENLIARTAQDNYYILYWWCLTISLTARDIRQGREELNRSLYRCMSDGSSHFLIPPLALYMLAVSQQDTSEETFYPFIKLWFLAPPYCEFGHHNLKEFKEEAAVFGDPYFINQEYSTKFINSREKNGLFCSVTRQSEREMESASRLVKMIRELRYTMEALSKEPILVDTGQYQPKYQNRTFQDMENEIARDLTKQPNFQAKVKLLSGECVIKTNDLPSVLQGELLTTRIEKIKKQMRTLGYCRYYKDVEKEIRERQQRLKSVSVSQSANVTSDEPPPAYY
ncbi:MAG: type IV secretory system conjugative DNA transfer family protein [Nitrososphaera sp.]